MTAYISARSFRGCALLICLGTALLAWPGENPGAGAGAGNSVSGTGDGAFWEKLSTRLLWSGSWEYGKNFANRGELRLSLPLASFGSTGRDELSFRFQVLDRRSTSSWEEQGLSTFALGLYHKATGSRLLYGQLDEWGLPARIRNPWIRSLPLVEYRGPSLADLKTDMAVSQGQAAYLYLGSPALESPVFGTWNVFVSALARQDLTDKTLGDQIQGSFAERPDLGGGIQGVFSNRRIVRVEGFYTTRILEAYRPSSWFSKNPPLPERDFRLRALSFLFSSPALGIAADGAYSETFAYGRGAYGSLGLRLGDRPWRLSLASDAIGGRYVGRDGSANGSGFRGGGRLERRGRRSDFFSVSTSLRGRTLEEGINKSNTVLNRRFPNNPGKPPSALRLAKITLTLKRDTDTLDTSSRPLDSAALLSGFQKGPVRVELGSALSWTAALEPRVFPDFSRLKNFHENLYEWEGSAKAAVRISALTLETKAAYSMTGDRGYWENSLAAVFLWREFRLRAALSYAGKTETLGFTLSWRFTRRW
jgi:hypothetical protein